TARHRLDLQWIVCLLNLFLYDKIRLSVRRDNQEIVIRVPDGGVDHFLLWVDRQYFRYAECEIPLVFEYFPKGVRNGIGFQTAGGDLVQQRLESVVIMLVEHNYLDFFIP